MMGKALCDAGFFSGKTVKPDKDNPHGFFENAGIRREVVKAALQAAGADPLGVNRLPQVYVPVFDLRERVESLLKGEGWRGEPWFYKETKLALMWPAWVAAFPDARWVIVWRDRDEIVDSCLRTGFMRQHSDDPRFWREWVDDYRARLNELRAHAGTITIHPPHGVDDLAERLLRERKTR